MNKQKAIMILLLVIPVLLVFYFFSPFLLMGFVDSSWYYSEEVDIGPFDYSSVLTKAENAGYEVEGSWPWPGNFSGFEPGDVPEVRERFGGAALVENIRLNYDENSELMVFICEEIPKNGLEEGQKAVTETCVALSNLNHTDPDSPLQLSEFPQDVWMLEKFGLLFGLDEKASEKYLEALKKAAQNQTWDAKIQVNESPDFPAVYANLIENRDDSSYESSLGINAYPTEVFLKDGKRLGSVKYFVPKAKVVTYDNENKYIVELDAQGKVRLEILMPPGSSGDEIPEEEYRKVFREIFKGLGLSPEVVDSFEFFHSSSRIW
ncbi:MULTISPECIES: hypothetical protein [unclassified Methanosarcina]|uniref:hypothetical protein n=1 Tax=unclassified Methanosarcina TaxID=2644672 RepID=UPI00061543DE|nr:MULTISPECIES: hypothetical protein [unclassified Methanosarcina]AKB18351.1 hypothetical protein MSWHS_1488 [Methanosarcina sp. WWM596]AKB22107.1 hypothetical protein MSWH1_1836 [Methanosarcina sp. WH1]